MLIHLNFSTSSHLTITSWIFRHWSSWKMITLYYCDPFHHFRLTLSTPNEGLHRPPICVKTSGYCYKNLSVKGAHQFRAKNNLIWQPPCRGKHCNFQFDLTRETRGTLRPEKMNVSASIVYSRSSHAFLRTSFNYDESEKHRQREKYWSMSRILISAVTYIRPRWEAKAELCSRLIYIAAAAAATV